MPLPPADDRLICRLLMAVDLTATLNRKKCKVFGSHQFSQALTNRWASQAVNDTFTNALGEFVVPLRDATGMGSALIFQL